MRRWPRVSFALVTAGLFVTLTGGSSATSARQVRADCAAAGGRAPVVAPRFVRAIATGETGWFSSPGLVDLNRDGRLEIVAPFYSTFVFDGKGRQLGKGTATKGRVYAPGVVADLDGDNVPEIVVAGNEGTVAAYDLVGGRLRLKGGWPASTCSGRPVPRGTRDGSRGSRPRRSHRGRRDDHEHLVERLPGVRVQRVGRPRITRQARPRRRGRASTG